MHLFAAPRPSALAADALAQLEADVACRLEAACMALPAASLHLAVSDQSACSRCWQALCPCTSSGVTCFSCGGSPTPGGQALHSDQCGAEFCCACLPTSSLVAAEMARADVAAELIDKPAFQGGTTALFALAAAMVAAQSLPPPRCQAPGSGAGDASARVAVAAYVDAWP